MDTTGVQYHQGMREGPAIQPRTRAKESEGLPMSRAKRDEGDDEALVRRVATQDRKAFEILYYRHTPKLSRYLSRFVRRPDVVEEIINDVMMVLWQRAKDYDGRARVSTWLFGIAHNKGLKALAKLGRESSREVGLELVESVEDESHADEMIQSDAARVLEEALSSLSADHRTVVELTFYWGFSYPEIAKIVDCPTNTVKTRMFHARQRLKQFLCDRGFEKTWTTLVDIQ